MSELKLNPNKIAKYVAKVNSILEEGRIPFGQKTKITHVSMGGNKGKFSLNKKQRKKQYKKFSLEQRRKSRISTENNGLPIVPTSLSIEEKEWIKSWKENHEK